MDYGVYPLPYPEATGKENADLIGGNFNIIPAKAKHSKEAWEFIKWLTGYQNEEWAAGMLAKGGLDSAVSGNYQGTGLSGIPG